MAQTKITPVVEDYLRTICALEEEIQPVIAARVADEAGVSPSTMVETLRRLERQGYIKVELEYITEGGERDTRLLGFLQDHKLVPGAKVQVMDVAPSLGIMNLKVGDDEFAIGIEAAKKIRVH